MDPTPFSFVSGSGVLFSLMFGIFLNTHRKVQVHTSVGYDQIKWLIRSGCWYVPTRVRLSQTFSSIKLNDKQSLAVAQLSYSQTMSSSSNFTIIAFGVAAFAKSSKRV
mgnify:CR=1 FL=1